MGSLVPNEEGVAQRQRVAKVTKLVWHKPKYDFRLVFVEDIPFCHEQGRSEKTSTPMQTVPRSHPWRRLSMHCKVKMAYELCASSLELCKCFKHTPILYNRTHGGLQLSPLAPTLDSAGRAGVPVLASSHGFSQPKEKKEHIQVGLGPGVLGYAPRPPDPSLALPPPTLPSLAWGSQSSSSGLSLYTHGWPGPIALCGVFQFDTRQILKWSNLELCKPPLSPKQDSFSINET